jgi:cobalamin biosynthesis Mg chelatase CobN
MSCSVLQFIDQLVRDGVWTPTQAASSASSLTAEQRAGEAGPFARRLVESKQLTVEQARAAMNSANASPVSAPVSAAAGASEESDLSMMLGIQPLRGVAGRTSSSGSSVNLPQVSQRTAKVDDGVSAMFVNPPLRGVTAPGTIATDAGPTISATGGAAPVSASSSATIRRLAIGAALLVVVAVVVWIVR